jgi:cytoskeletal protein CcmA (bactofilin family)
MFNAKNKTAETPTGSTTIIGAGTVIRGNIESDGDIRIDGTLIGNLHAKAKVLIGVEGMVEGDVIGHDADVLGKITGQLKINELLQLRGNSKVSGEIYAGKLEVEPTATFNGNCHMGANVVELNAELGNVVNK